MESVAIMALEIIVDDHPVLDLQAFVTNFPSTLKDLNVADGLVKLLSLNAPTEWSTDDEVRAQVRDLLRHGGFKPTGRSKPASEYLIKAAGANRLTSITVAVDACNAVSLHSGLPISVVDLDRVEEPLRVGVAAQGSSYVFNAAGQTIDIGGLLCLSDANGPCANAVKDSQRTKTDDATVRTLSLIWGSCELPQRAEQARQWYEQLLQSHGATIGNITTSRP